MKLRTSVLASILVAGSLSTTTVQARPLGFHGGFGHYGGFGYGHGGWGWGGVGLGIAAGALVAGALAAPSKGISGRASRNRTVCRCPSASKSRSFSVSQQSL